MAKPIHKTNAIRQLDKAKISYKLHAYETDGSLAAQEVARVLNQDAEKVFKTLVTTDGKNFFVFCIPSFSELDLKKAAKAASLKRLEMLKQKDLFSLTGYVHGGCSPVGMKKLFPTFIHNTAENLKTFYVSAGKIGLQMEINPQELKIFINAQFADLIK